MLFSLSLACPALCGLNINSHIVHFWSIDANNIHLLPPCPLLIFHPSARNLNNILIIMENTLKSSLPANHLSHSPVWCMLSSLLWPDLPAKLQSLHPVRESYPLAQRLCIQFFEGTTKCLPTFPLEGALFIKIQPSCSVTCEFISLQTGAHHFLLPSRLKHPLFLPLSSPHCTFIASLPFPLSRGCIWLYKITSCTISERTGNPFLMRE